MSVCVGGGGINLINASPCIIDMAVHLPPSSVLTGTGSDCGPVPTDVVAAMVIFNCENFGRPEIMIIITFR